MKYREVELGQSVNKQRVVQNGLSAGDRVIVDGTQFVRPNDTVAAKEVTAQVTKQDSQVANK